MYTESNDHCVIESDQYDYAESETVAVKTYDGLKNFTGEWSVKAYNEAEQAYTDDVEYTKTNADSTEITFAMPAHDVSVAAICKAAPTKYTLTVTGGEGSGSYAENEEVTITAKEPETGKKFTKWVTASDLTLNSAAVDLEQSELTFNMPASAVTITAEFEDTEPADVPDQGASSAGGEIGGAIAAVAVGGAAVWGGYEIVTRVMLYNMLPKGTEIPSTRAKLAMLVWNNAGKPEPVSAPAFADVSDAETAKAAQWCTEQGYLDAREDGGFKPDGWVPKYKVIQVWNQAFAK